MESGIEISSFYDDGIPTFVTPCNPSSCKHSATVVLAIALHVYFCGRNWLTGVNQSISISHSVPSRVGVCSTRPWPRLQLAVSSTSTLSSLTFVLTICQQSNRIMTCGHLPPGLICCLMTSGALLCILKEVTSRIAPCVWPVSD